MTSRKVMLVDDNDLIRDSVEIFFQTEGIDIVTATSGKECLRYLEQGFRGILLMDVQMPCMDGWETIRAIVDRGLYGGNLIVMLTASDHPDTRMNQVAQYVTDYITKPFHPNRLLELVRHYLKLQKQCRIMPQ